MTLPPDAAPSEQDLLLAALRRLMGPMARLAVARGVSHASLEELLKQALVDAADAAHPELPPHRRVSRISTATGIHRREVTRLMQVLREGRTEEALPRRSRAREALAHWLATPCFCDARGLPRNLPRQGRESSFEALAQAVTRDVHPRSLLDEMVRLGMVRHDPATDTVCLDADATTPKADAGRLQFLGANVGDHLEGAVDNVLGDGRRHFERAVSATGLPEAALAQIAERVNAQWQGLLQAMVPALEAAVAAGEQAPGPHRRVRIGLYAFDKDMPAPPAEGDGSTKGTPT
ncbi:DUF6502 family protein [Ideonella sp. A 288]|uniref:DUF6502 family protein n=1 Tax=Ideonella sp. A 288 TaxID=1962181 RepID=UPI000B4C0DC1|nr:DUF6502 family protein [Ideonella sp. A 288]